MLIAETVQFEIPAWFVALALAVVLLIVMGIVGVVIVGFRAAARAGRGSKRSLALWLSIAAVESLVGLYGLAQRGYVLFWLVPLGIVGMQVFAYVESKNDKS